ncbi:MAG TPA: PIG-L deacetylase family protein [Chloroflexia bacterium]|nr:PIG-L deacetylase family protein [Chloroflexia bacterium]
MTQPERAAAGGASKTPDSPVAPAPAPLELIGPPQAPAVEGAPAGPTTVLLIAAHPDDPEFSSAGTIAQWVAAGLHVVYVLVTSGDKGTADKAMTNARLSSAREQEQLAAAHEVGVDEVVFLRFPDGLVQPDLRLRGEITRQIRRYRPYAVLVHDPLTLFYNNQFINHPDHRAVGTATVDAIYPTARDPLQYPEQITEEGLEPHKVKEIYLWGSDQANVVSDISAVLDKKIAALRHHATQVGPAEELADRIRTRAGETGALAGVPYGEAYRRVVMRA